MLFMSLALITVMGFSQNDTRQDLAKAAAKSLTTSMTQTLGLTDMQKEAVEQYNMSYALSFFTTDPLTDDVIKEFDKALDANMKETLGDEQYEMWIENKTAWLDSVKSKLPKEEAEIMIEEADLNLLK